MDTIIPEAFSGNSVLSVEAACTFARAREEAGDYAGACVPLGQWWKLDQEPLTKGLDWRAKALLLLRVGTLTGWLGGAGKSGAHNKKAQGLIIKSLALFESMDDKSNVAQCKIELGYCYYREGALDLACEVYQSALELLNESEEVELQVVALVRRAIVEQVSSRLRESKATLELAARLLKPKHNIFLQGRFYNAYAITLKALGQAENDFNLLQQASTCYEQARKCFERAGSLRSQAVVLNNLAGLLATLGQTQEAERHFYDSRRLFAELQDVAGMAQPNEGLARLFIKFKRYEESVKVIAESVKALRDCGEEAWLALALTTQGVTLARLCHWVEARYAFNEALHTAERCADFEGAGKAALSLVEEMCDRLSYTERREFFARAEYLLAATQSNEVRERLRSCGHLVAAAEEQDRKQREQEIQNEKMASLGQLAFGVAHNFNNALTIIKGRTQLLQRLTLPENAEKNLNLIAEAVDDSTSMIRRIRDFGRPRTAESFIRVDVAKLLDSVVEMVRPRCREQQVQIGWERGAPLLLQGDPGELKEVFVNIIYNALDALAGEGRITISTRLTGNNVELRFSDTGPGMSEEVRAHIFEPFFSTKGGKGTGLGLATCYSIINGHSGVIEVESEPGAGATFKITLPLTPAQTPAASEPELLVPGAHRHQEAALTV